MFGAFVSTTAGRACCRLFEKQVGDAVGQGAPSIAPSVAFWHAAAIAKASQLLCSCWVTGLSECAQHRGETLCL